MKSVLISIQPKWCELIANGKKTVEVRKTKPKLETPFKVYIYMTKEYNRGINSCFYYYKYGKVIGEFVCDKICEFEFLENDVFQYRNPVYLGQSCLTYDELINYIGENKIGYGWHISDLVIYDNPKELSEFWKLGKCPYAYGMLCTYEGHCYRAGQEIRCGETLTRPPQSWCYVEELG
jgi:predicted transcriptional regulator